MKISQLLAAVLASAACFSANAQTCPGGTTQVNNLNPVSGNQICACRSGERWQEWHGPAGNLWDYKLGPGHPVDPTKIVGTWSVTNGANALLTHTYGTTSYSFRVCRIGPVGSTSYTLVSTTAGTVTPVTLLPASATPVGSCAPCP